MSSFSGGNGNVSLDWDGMQNMTYKCLKCGAEVKGEGLYSPLLFLSEISKVKCPMRGEVEL
ncbi:MAG: hypothetical protein QXD09_05470 [Candidatus Caldarchaeum sp.]